MMGRGVLIAHLGAGIGIGVSVGRAAAREELQQRVVQLRLERAVGERAVRVVQHVRVRVQVVQLVEVGRRGEVPVLLDVRELRVQQVLVGRVIDEAKGAVGVADDVVDQVPEPRVVCRHTALVQLASNQTES